MEPFKFGYIVGDAHYCARPQLEKEIRGVGADFRHLPSTAIRDLKMILRGANAQRVAFAAVLGYWADLKGEITFRCLRNPSFQRQAFRLSSDRNSRT